MKKALGWSAGGVLGLLTLIGVIGAGSTPQANLTTSGSATSAVESPVASLAATTAPTLTPLVTATPEATPTPRPVTPAPATPVPASTYQSSGGTDSYINSAGNEVQSPTYYDSAPAGASAQCSDGTYSFSQSRRGTCSHHGGVAVWL